MSDMKDWRRETSKERKFYASMTGDAARFAALHRPCRNCISRQQRRQMIRDAQRRHHDWHCCSVDVRTGTREHDPRKHAHPRDVGAMDHATGVGANTENDRSMTRAVYRRLTGEERIDPQEQYKSDLAEQMLM